MRDENQKRQYFYFIEKFPDLTPENIKNQPLIKDLARIIILMIIVDGLFIGTIFVPVPYFIIPFAIFLTSMWGIERKIISRGNLIGRLRWEGFKNLHSNAFLIAVIIVLYRIDIFGKSQDEIMSQYQDIVLYLGAAAIGGVVIGGLWILLRDKKYKEIAVMMYDEYRNE